MKEKEEGYVPYDNLAEDKVDTSNLATTTCILADPKVEK